MSWNYSPVPLEDSEDSLSLTDWVTGTKGSLSRDGCQDEEIRSFLHLSQYPRAKDEPIKDDPSHMSLRNKVIVTAPIYAAFIGFSLCRNLYGPTLGELQQLVGTTVDTISTIFTYLGAGGIAGCLVFGCLFDRGDPLLLFVFTLAPLGLITIFVPWWPHLVVMMGLSAAQSFFFTGISVGCNVVIMRLWSSRACALLSIMHFLFTVGGFLAPQIAEQFTWQPNGSLGNMTGKFGAPAGLSVSAGNISCQNIINHTAGGEYKIPLNYTCSPVNLLSYNISTNGYAGTMVGQLPPNSAKSRIHFAFLIVGVYLEIVTLWMAFVYINFRNKYNWELDINEPKHNNSKSCGLCAFSSKSVSILATIFFFLFNSFFGGKEMMYMGLLYTFALDQVGMGITEAAFLVSVHFAMYGVGRFIVVFIVSRVAPRNIVLSAILVGCGSALLLSLAPGPSKTIMWITNITTGLSLASVFSVGLLWAETYMPVTGCFTSTYVIAYTLGMMTWPAVTGYLYKHSGPMWFAHMNSLLIIGCSICACALNLLWWCRHTNKEIDFGSEKKSLTVEVKEQTAFDKQNKTGSQCLHP